MSFEISVEIKHNSCRQIEFSHLRPALCKRTDNPWKVSRGKLSWVSHVYCMFPFSLAFNPRLRQEFDTKILTILEFMSDENPVGRSGFRDSRLFHVLWLLQDEGNINVYSWNWKDVIYFMCARLDSERAVRVRALAGDIVLCSWARHFNLTVPLSTQVCKCVPANCLGNLTNCGEVTCDGLASRPGEIEILLAASCYRNRDKLR